MPGTMKITRSESKKTPEKILRIEAENAYVFIARDTSKSIYLNIGGKRFDIRSETPVTLEEK